jgi:AcrR family transcriptional regulator
MALAGKSKHDVVSEFRCAEILAAARKVFATRGFSEATMDEIASEAGIAKGTVYLYFSSKKDIYLAALIQGVLELHERTAAKMAAAAGVEAKLRSFVRTRIEYAEEHRDFIKIYHSEFGNLTNAAACGSEFQELYLKQAKMLEIVLQSAVESGEIRPVRADFAAFIIYAMVKGVMTLRLMGWSTGGVEDDVGVLSELVWKGLCLNEANGLGVGGLDGDDSASGRIARAGSVFG